VDRFGDHRGAAARRAVSGDSAFRAPDFPPPALPCDPCTPRETGWYSSPRFTTRTIPPELNMLTDPVALDAPARLSRRPFRSSAAGRSADVGARFGRDR